METIFVAMNTAYLSLGSNKGDTLQNLQQAIKLLEKEIGSIKEVSCIYITAPWGNTAQPEFKNQAVCIHTDLTANELLKKTIEIEEKLGRIRTEQKWMERTIDIDILFYNNEVINMPNLTIPHPYLHQRKFVLIPLKEIASRFIHPVLNKQINTLLEECTDTLEVKCLK